LGFTCGVVAEPSVPLERNMGMAFYCFSVYTQDTGSPKPSTELELLTRQLQEKTSIFTCNEWDVFSDVSVGLGDSGVTTIKVEDEFGEFHQTKRKITKSWVNWGLFYQVRTLSGLSFPPC